MTAKTRAMVRSLRLVPGSAFYRISAPACDRLTNTNEPYCRAVIANECRNWHKIWTNFITQPNLNQLRMNKIFPTFIFFFLLCFSNCEKSKNIENTSTNAKISGFVVEKCMCCWGWVITLDSQIIKADSLPGISPNDNLNFPINVHITIGVKTRSCEDYSLDNNSLPDYYQIKTITLIK